MAKTIKHARPQKAPATFWIALAFLPILFLILIEMGLRVAGLRESYPLFTLVEDDHRFMAASDDVARRYFRQQVVPTIPFDAFLAEPDTGGIRIVLQGGSSAAGYPYYFGSGIADALESRLESEFPGRQVEVINTAMAAVNSFTLLDLAPEIAAIRPDVVVIYAGHNEYYGALGVASSESSHRISMLGRLYLRARRLAVTQIVEKVIRSAVSAFGETDGDDSGTLMARMVREPAILLDSPTYRTGIRQFEANIGRLLAFYRKRGIPVVISTVASNLKDQPPLGSKPAIDRRRRVALVDSTVNRQWQIPREIETDSLSADAAYVRAHWMLSRERTGEARPEFERARDLDHLRFRAPGEINVVIRRQASRYGAKVAEADRTLGEQSGKGIPGAEVFADHLHPNVRGYGLVVDAILSAIDSAGILPKSRSLTAQRPHRPALIALDSLAGHYRVRQIVSNWPFTEDRLTYNRPTNPPSEHPVEKLSFRYFKNEVSRYAALNELQIYYQSVGQHDKAIAVIDRVIDEYPFLAVPPLTAGRILLAQRDLQRAFEYLEKARLVAESAEVLKLMGSIRLEQRRREEGIAYLEKSFELDPDDNQTLFNLGGAYALTGRPAEARSVLERLVERNPEDQRAALLLQRVRALKTSDQNSVAPK